MASLIAGGVFYLVPKVTSFSEGKGPGNKSISRVTRFHCKNGRYHVCFYGDACMCLQPIGCQVRRTHHSVIAFPHNLKLVVILH